MKNANKCLLFRSILFLAAAFGLVACGGNGLPDAASHDTRYRAVDAAGQVLDPSVAPGDCVFDELTGLTWEGKTSAPGLHHALNTYTWFNPDESHDGELDYRGKPDGGECTGSSCDTTAYVAAVNAAGLCSFTDWRMPGRDELGSISDPRRKDSPPTANLRFFPNMQAAEYWSANDYHFQWNGAWVWSFENGMDRVEWKDSPRHVRLVRGTASRVARVKD